MNTILSIITSLDTCLVAEADPELAQSQSAYMRSLWPFLGIPKPRLLASVKPYIKQLKGMSAQDFCSVIEMLWHKPEREYQYVALEIGRTYHRVFGPEDLQFFKGLITRKSWWDTVDVIAPYMVGSIIQRHPLLLPQMKDWTQDENMWVRRTSLLFQLHYKQKTHVEELLHNCVQLMHEKEFFIRKAIGWVLREYSKTDPLVVRRFVDQYKNQLSPLSYREATKYC